MINSAHDKHRGSFEVSGKWQQIYSTYGYIYSPLFFLMLIHVQLFGTRWTVAHQAPLSIGFQARMLEWAALPTLEDPPSPGTEPASPASPASAGGFLTTTLPGKPRHICEYAKETCAYAHT